MEQFITITDIRSCSVLTSHCSLSHAFANNVPRNTDSTEPDISTGESGILIIDATGRIHSASPDALWLLYEACGIPQTEKTLGRSARGDVQFLLRRFAQRVEATMDGLAGLPPFAVFKNDYGSFHVRAYALDAFSPGMPALTSLHIERRAPLSLRLFRSPKFLALTPREREMCQLILAGHSNTEIARQLFIKPASVIAYTKSLYRRFVS